MTDEKTLQQIANQLLPRYRLFLVTGQGGGSLTQQEREMLVKIRDNANNVQLEELQPYVNRNVTDSMVASRSYGFLATILNEYSGGVRETYWGANNQREEMQTPEEPASPRPDLQPLDVDYQMAERYSPESAFREILKFVDPKYLPYFETGQTNVGGQAGEQFRDRYPGVQIFNKETRETIASIRTRLLAGVTDTNLQIDLAKFVDSGEDAPLAAGAMVREILDRTFAVRGGEDPYGRSEDVPGFGRGTAGLGTVGLGQVSEPRPLGTGAEDIEPGEAARPGADVGMVSSVTIQPGGADDGDSTGGEAGGGTGGGGTGGGAGGAGVGGGGVGVETPYDDSVPEDWKQAASEIYGAYYSIISQNPEVADLIAEAEANKWGPEKFDYALEQTTWWKTTSLATRTFDIEMQRDPATVQARIDALSAQIREDALSLNIRLTGETLNTIATEAIRQGWTEQQVTIALGDEAVKSQAGVTGLRYGYYGNKINEIAASYGVSVSDLEFSQLVEKFALGRENEESLTAAFQTRATALFPAISERLMAGETFANIVEPYRNRASQILGQNFSASDFMDNDSFAQAVTFTGEDGKQRPMTYTEWGQYLRSNREFGYEYTDEAQGRAYQVANRIADLFGAI